MLHIDIPTSATLRQLAAHRSEGSVTVYLTTGTLPEEAERARIELGNLRDEAVRQLSEVGTSRAAIDELVEALDELAEDHPFWSHQSETLAVFAADGVVRSFRLPNRLPTQLEVADRFLIKPLVRALTFPHAAFVLALSQNEVRLVELSADLGAHRVDVAGLPESAADVAGKSSISGRSAAGRIQGSEGQKVRMRQYSRAVETALRPLLNGTDVPLILAAAQPINAIYRSVNSYHHLAAESVHGNPEEASDAEIGEAARPVLDGIYAQQLTSLQGEYAEAFSRGNASADLSDVARAATYGAIDTLLFDFESSATGFIDEAGVITFAEEDDAITYGVIDEIVRRALSTGTRILAVRADDMPVESPVAATFRFPV